MDVSMAPPVLPGFSLRVQLFSPNAYGAGDRPIRCFRVVTSPDVTIREFCQEASRIHKINYGEPIAIKKCQDDQEFDVTQSEIVGSLFASGATMRVIQASPTGSIRDSVPPNSALRYDPGPKTNLKRRRATGGSSQPNGAPSTTWDSNKRQRLSDLDPDDPIPSSEREMESTLEDRGERNVTTIPDSQQSTGRLGHVRTEIPNSLSPSPPALLHPIHNENGSTDQQRHKPANPSIDNASWAVFQGSPSRPVVPVSAPEKLKSASYHIERPTERGASVSTAATSPLSTDQQLAPQKRVTSTTERRISGPITNARINGKPNSRSPNEDTIYDVDEIESESESSAAILNKTKTSLKIRKSPLNGLPGQERANKFNTPPNGNRRNSRGGEQVYAPELPLTPSSKRREEKRQQADDVREPRIAAAEAAEQRRREASEQERREAEEARQAERVRNAEAARLKKEELEREAAKKRAAINATAARLERERVEKMKREKKAEEGRQSAAKHLEEVRIRKTKELAEKLEREKQAMIEKQRWEEERKSQEKAKAEAEIERLRKEEGEQKRKAGVAAAEQLRKSKAKAQTETETETLTRKSSSASVESIRSGTPIRPSQIIRPQSSTPFIPTGRKSALKSSQVTVASSPMLPRNSPPSTAKSSSQIAPPNDHPRRVSFNLEVTPIRPSKTITPKSSKLQKEVPPEKQSHTPILPPSMNKLRKDQGATPILPPSQSIASKPAPVHTTPQISVKSASPVPVPSSKQGDASRSTAPKETLKSVDTATVPPSAIDTSSEGSDSDEDVPDRLNPAQILNAAIRREATPPAKATKPDPESEEQVDEEQEDDVEMTSGQSSPPETRSPVIFSQHVAPLKPVPALELSKNADDAEMQSASEISSSDEESEESSGEPDEEDELDEEETERQEASPVQVPQSSINLPRAEPNSRSYGSRGKQKQRKNQLSPSSSDRDSSTQDAIDYQLTSSMYEADASSPSLGTQKPVKSRPVPGPSSSQRPTFKIGASLQSLNAVKNMIGSSQTKASPAVNGNFPTNSKDGEKSEGESESVEDTESSDSESEDEEEAADAPEAQLSQARTVPLPDSDFDSSSDEDSEEEYREKMRKELVTDLAKMSRMARAHGSVAPSPIQHQGNKERSRIAGSDILKAEKKKRDNKYLTGYSFSQVR